MTVAIGLACSDGVIVASDSMLSAGAIAQTGEKVFACRSLPLVWTAAGTVYTIEEVAEALRNMEADVVARAATADFTVPNPRAVREQVHAVIWSTMQQCYGSALPGGANQMIPGTSVHQLNACFLLLGYGAQGSYFLAIYADGTVNWHRKFAAIGSGGQFASVTSALMEHYIRGADLCVELGLQVAYRAIEATCRVSSQLVGLPVCLAVADSSGARVLREEEVERIGHDVEGWIELEANTLRKRAAPAPPPEPLPTIADETTITLTRDGAPGTRSA